MAISSSRGVFLSYRRDDAAPYARLVQGELNRRMPNTPVFLDMDSIEAGQDFPEALSEALGSCAVFVALIGRQWAVLADENGNRRLDDPDDYVRFEVKTALERGIQVIPVLVGGARPLTVQQLPSDLGKLAQLQAVELSHDRHRFDVGRLLDRVQRTLTVNAQVFARRVLADAERIASSIARESPRAVALADIARVLAGPDPDHAARLIADAERIAETIDDQATLGGFEKVRALVRIAGVLAATDPVRAARLIDNAERIAQSMTRTAPADTLHKVVSLDVIARALAVSDPGRAEQIAQSIPGGNIRASTLAGIALTVTDPARAARLIDDAERIARATPEGQGTSLAEIVKALAATDPDRAERIALAIPEDLKGGPLAEIVKAVAATDPDRAERIALAIPRNRRVRALADIARAVAVSDPGRSARLIAEAERIASSLTENFEANALAEIAAAVAVIDPDRAAALIDDAERVAQSFTPKQAVHGFADIAEAMWPGDAAVAVADPGHAPRPTADRGDTSRLEAEAERIVRVIIEGMRTAALGYLAKELAAVVPDRAERVAWGISDQAMQVDALVAIVEAQAGGRAN